MSFPTDSAITEAAVLAAFEASETLSWCLLDANGRLCRVSAGFARLFDQSAEILLQAAPGWLAACPEEQGQWQAEVDGVTFRLTAERLLVAPGGMLLLVRQGEALTRVLPAAVNQAEPAPCYRVLVVDDNDINRLVAERALQKLGHVTVPAANGEEALARLADESFDLVLMDCEMPVLDGMEATRRWRAREQGGRLPIVAVAANILPEVRAEALAAGMDDFLPKPLRLEELRLRLPAWIASARQACCVWG